MTGDRLLVEALALGAAWATFLAAAPSLWPRPRPRPLPEHPDTPPSRTTPGVSEPGPTPRIAWITAIGATIRRHTIQRPVTAPQAGRNPYPPWPASATPLTNHSHRATIATSAATTLTPTAAQTTGDPPPAAGGDDRLWHLHASSGPAALPHPGAAPSNGSAAGPGARAGGQRADHRTGWAALTSLGLLPLAPALAPLPLAFALAAPVLTARSARRRHDAALVDQLPDVVELLSLATAAGLPVTAALGAIANRPGGPLGAGIGRAAAHLRAGGPLAGALAQLGAVGSQARPLVDALAHHDRYGSPLLPALERVAIEARARRRRQAEEAARRLPVTLLFPLLLTTFPAFVALTVVPLVAGSLGALNL